MKTQKDKCPVLQALLSVQGHGIFVINALNLAMIIRFIVSTFLSESLQHRIYWTWTLYSNINLELSIVCLRDTRMLMLCWAYSIEPGQMAQMFRLAWQRLISLPGDFKIKKIGDFNIKIKLFLRFFCQRSLGLFKKNGKYRNGRFNRRKTSDLK